MPNRLESHWRTLFSQWTRKIPMLCSETESEGVVLGVSPLAPPWALDTGDIVHIIRNEALSKEFGAKASEHEHWL